MFFIAGTGKEAIPICKGEFLCPQCDELRQYVQKRISGYVSAFFVPVWRSSGGTEFVECQSCGGQFDNCVLDSSFERGSEITRLTDAAAESGAIALESRDPKIARSHYDIALEAYRLALGLRPPSDLERKISRTMDILEEEFPSSVCMNEALGLCDEANRHSAVTEQLELLKKAEKLLEDGLARRDSRYNEIKSIYDQVVPYIKQAEMLVTKLGQ